MKRIFLGMYCILLILSLILIPVCAVDVSWTQATDHAAFSPRTSFSMAVYDDRMWVIGGMDTGNQLHNDVWYSTDGVTWIMATGSAAFSPRHGHTTVVFDNRIWVIGGYDSSRTYRNDVWYSSDGITWIEATSHAAFQPRMNHASDVYDGKMWVIGGEVSERPGGNTNDVWYSSDGVTWIPATGSASFSPRSAHGSIVFEEKLWVVGGAGDTSGKIRYNDVWYSSDGKEWILKAGSTAFSPRFAFTLLNAEDRLLLIDGSDSDVVLNDIWSSTDGNTWVLSSSGSRFSKRAYHRAVFYNHTIWVVGGFDETNRYFNDVWYLPEPVSIASAGGIVLNKSVSPWSVKQGTDVRVSLMFTNTGNSPVHDIEILDTTLPEFPVSTGSNRTANPQMLMPNETRIIVYSIHAAKAGEFTLPKASALYAGADGNYHKIVSNAPSVEVIAPLISPTAPGEDQPDNFPNNVMKWISSFF
jgi:hypothetical protein